MRRSVAVVIAASLVLGACSSGGAPTAGTSIEGDSSSVPAPSATEPVPSDAPAVTETPPTDAPTTTEALPTGPTPWSESIDAFDPEGTPNVDAALAMFALAFGPIEGFPAPPDDTGASGDVSVAFRAVAGVWDQLSEEQRSAVLAATSGNPESSTVTVFGLRSGQHAAAAPDPDVVAAINDAALDIRGQIAAKIGDFPGTLTVIVADKDDADKDFGVAVPEMKPDGNYTGNCTLSIFPKATSDVYALLNTIAHEVFHCFQLAALGGNAAYATAPGWVVEGGAEWVAATITAPDVTTSNRWGGWFAGAFLPLQQKKYSALAFWAHLAEVGVDPWSVFRTVWAARGTPAAFVAAGANTPAFLDSWASGMTRNSTFPSGWDTTGPGITDDSMEVTPLAVGAPGQQSVTTPPYTTSAYSITTEADVLVFNSTGHARVSDGTVDVVDPDGIRFCKKTGGCTCPNVPDDVPPAPIGEPVVALTGGPEGTGVTVIGLTLELHCDEREQKAVQVTADRPASEGVLAGQVLELTACNGVYGDWNGVIRLGGLSLDGFEVAFQEIPLSFTFSGTGVQTVQASAGGVVQTPVFPLEVNYDLSITVDGQTMTITGTGSGDTDLFTVETALPGAITGLPIVPAPEGVCAEQ
jgi:hypothetical protein